MKMCTCGQARYLHRHKGRTYGEAIFNLKCKQYVEQKSTPNPAMNRESLP